MSTKAVNDGLNFGPETSGQSFFSNVTTEVKALFNAFQKARLMQQLINEGVDIKEAYHHVFEEAPKTR